MSDNRLVMYTRSAFICPYVKIAERVFKKHDVEYVEVDIDQDDAARQRVLDWTGFLSVPTLVIAENDAVMPLDDPTPLAEGDSPRGVDRGYMLTEPNGKQLERWLEKHGIIS